MCETEAKIRIALIVIIRGITNEYIYKLKREIFYWKKKNKLIDRKYVNSFIYLFILTMTPAKYRPIKTVTKYCMLIFITFNYCWLVLLISQAEYK